MLAFKPVILWTDALIYLLVATAAVFFVYARRREHLRDPWRQVTRSRLGMSALVVLSAYSTVALLDSLHFRQALPPTNKGQVQYAAEALSVFDLLVTPLRTRTEKTYSAPMATHLYAKETMQLSDGATVRGFPRLKYGGSHLRDPEGEHASDIIKRSLTAVTAGLLVWIIMSLGVVAWLARRWREPFMAALTRVAGGRSDLPWIVVFVTGGALVILAAWIVALAPLYHVLGTDKVGQDVLYQALKSIRSGLVIGTVTTLVTLPFAVLLGIMAGFFKGWVDDVVQYLYTTLNSIPGVLLIAAVGEIDLRVGDRAIIGDLVGVLRVVGADDGDPIDAILDACEELLHALAHRRIVRALLGAVYHLSVEAGALADTPLLEQVDRLLALGAGQLELRLVLAGEQEIRREQRGQQADPSKDDQSSSSV